VTAAAPRVFLVDDHHLFRRGVRAELGDAADVVGEASEVDAAVEMIGERLPDVVLVDVHMPGGGGEAVIRGVRAGHPGVRFLALSVSDAPEDVIPAILMLATLGLTIKTLVGLASGSTFAYFVQPVATTVILSMVFLGSVVIGRPIIARLAHDFCPIHPDVAARQPVMQLFAGLTVLWAVVHIVIGGATFAMLVTLPVAQFVALKTVTSFGVSAAAIVVTVVWALRIARDEGLVMAVA